jgi:hypothetical protein
MLGYPWFRSRWTRLATWNRPLAGSARVTSASSTLALQAAPQRTHTTTISSHFCSWWEQWGSYLCHREQEVSASARTWGNTNWIHTHNYLTQLSWALLEKLPVAQLIENFPKNLWNPYFHNLVHKSPSMIPILSQTNPVLTIPSYLSKIHFNIIHSPTCWSSFWLSHQNHVCIPFNSHSCYMPCPSHPHWPRNCNYTWQAVQVMKLLNMQLMQLAIAPSFLDPDILLSSRSHVIS